MENVFGGTLQVYGEGWTKVNERNFNDVEKSAIRSNSVVESDFGKSVCFLMKSGGQSYIPLSRNSVDNISVGASINMDTAKLVTLRREGDGNILRVEL